MPRRLVAALFVVVLAACAAVYPELATRLRRAPAGARLDPPPPREVRWIRFVSARVPPRTRDGRTWDQLFGSLPDPYAKLVVNGRELIRTPSQSDTLTPTWPDGPRGNFRIEPHDRLRVELWDANALGDEPIGIKDIGVPTEDQRLAGEIQVELPAGGQLVLAFEPAHAMLGYGFWYELRTETCFITRLLDESPALRAGMQPGDEVLEIGGRAVRTLNADEIRSAINAMPAGGLRLTLRRPHGAVVSTVVNEGPIYPIHGEYGPIE